MPSKPLSTAHLIKGIALVMGLNALSGILVTLLGFSWPEEQALLIIPMYILVLFLGLVFLAGSYALWRMQPWAWWLAATWCAMVILRTLLVYFLQGSIPMGAEAFWLLITLASFVYLFRKEMGGIFNIQLGRPKAAAIVSAAGFLIASLPYFIAVSLGALA